MSAQLSTQQWIPEGYVLAPLEATKEMYEAACKHYESDEFTEINSTYKVMIAVAPKP